MRNRRKTKAVEVRFWAYVDVQGPEACWNWLGGVKESGYGTFWLAGKHVVAHRMAYKLIWGEIPPKKFILQMCVNPLCCNPAHLRPGSTVDNIKLKGIKPRRYIR